MDSSSQWRSGANIHYSNFSDQINTTQLSCVAIDKYGSWIVSDCGNRYSFVCGESEFIRITFVFKQNLSFVFAFEVTGVSTTTRPTNTSGSYGTLTFSYFLMRICLREMLSN